MITILITLFKVLITLFLNTHEPPSGVYRVSGLCRRVAVPTGLLRSETCRDKQLIGISGDGLLANPYGQK